MKGKLDNELVSAYGAFLMESEKSGHTIEKYLRDLRKFQAYLNGRSITREEVEKFREELLHGNYAKSSANSVMVSLNTFFHYVNEPELIIKDVATNVGEKKDALTEAEFQRLCAEAFKYKKKGYYYLIKVIRETGLRISEINYFTVENLREKVFYIPRKSEFVRVELSEVLAEQLLKYALYTGKESGPVFITAKGKPLDRSNVWRKLREFARIAGIPEEKVSPDNLRLVGNEQIEVSAD